MDAKTLLERVFLELASQEMEEPETEPEPVFLAVHRPHDGKPIIIGRYLGEVGELNAEIAIQAYELKHHSSIDPRDEILVEEEQLEDLEFADKIAKALAKSDNVHLALDCYDILTTHFRNPQDADSELFALMGQADAMEFLKEVC